MQRQTIRDVLNAAVTADIAAPPAVQMLKLWRQLTPDTWAEQLNKRAADMLVGSYMKDSRWPEVLEVFQQRKSHAQVGAHICIKSCMQPWQCRGALCGPRALETPLSLGWAVSKDCLSASWKGCLPKAVFCMLCMLVIEVTQPYACN